VAHKKRLVWQIFPTYLFIIVISLLAVTWFASGSLKRFFLNQVREDLKVRAMLFENRVRKLIGTPDEKNIDILCDEVGADTGTRITVILVSGEVVGDSEEDPSLMDNHRDRPEFSAALRGDMGTSIRFSRTLRKNLMYVGIPVEKEGKLVAVVRTSIPLDSVESTIRGLQTRIALGGLIIAILSALLSLYISRRISRPIEEIKASAECYARGDFQCSVPITDLEEISALSEAMKKMARDLDNRIKTIEEQKNEIKAILSSMVEGVIAVDNQENVISLNEAAGKMFDCDPSWARGKSIQEALRNSSFLAFVSETLTRDEPVEKEIVLSPLEERYLTGHGTRLMNKEGDQIGAVFVLNDITRLKRLENIRKDFVANVSHELKTPITAIKGFVETLLDNGIEDSADRDRFLKIIDKHVIRLVEIIEDLLRLSKIEKEAENNEIVFTEGRIKPVLKTAMQVCESKAVDRQIEFELDCDDQISASINPALLEQAIINLLDNAIKYSDEKSKVIITAVQDPEEIKISIKDTGSGIERRHLPRLFERFYRVDKARSRELGGTGLGLAIVKHISQAHGGRVTVETELGKGSVFTIHIPKNEDLIQP